MSDTTDYDLVRQEIASFLGTPESSWDNRTAFDVESSIRRGIEAVVHNVHSHQWSWMRPAYRFSTADGQRAYTLPLDFEQFIDDIYFDGENYRYPSIKQLPSGRLSQMYSEYSSTGVPSNYALEAASHDGTSQQHQQVILHPTPDGEYALVGPYQVGPIRTLSAARPWFPGGPENRELFIASCLAAAESKFMDQPATDKRDMFDMALTGAIGRDYRKQARNLGQSGWRHCRTRDAYRWKLSTLYEGTQDM